MKKHLFRTLVFICGLALFSSCMKDDPKNNETVYYAYQQIPNINEFMPQTLLNAFSNYLYYGDEPPKIEGSFVVDNIWITDAILSPGSPWMAPITSIPTPQYFEFYEQHKGIAKLNFKYPKGTPSDYTYFVERSDPDSTYAVVTADPEFFINDTIAPSYFKNDNYKKEDFNTVYIMGNDPYFTVYYYEIRDIKSKAQPLNAVIFSGRMDKEITVVNDTVNQVTDTVVKPVIKDLKWCIETMKYYKEGTSISQIISLGFLPSKGDAMILKNEGVVHTGEFHE
ncbi:MAG: hypothetical protein J6T22_11070 [Bacteroidales bacterium]|nr:hypothetical protein [Bacteroidales bacterium]